MSFKMLTCSHKQYVGSSGSGGSRSSCWGETGSFSSSKSGFDSSSSSSSLSSLYFPPLLPVLDRRLDRIFPFFLELFFDLESSWVGFEAAVMVEGVGMGGGGGKLVKIEATLIFEPELEGPAIDSLLVENSFSFPTVRDLDEEAVASERSIVLSEVCDVVFRGACEEKEVEADWLLAGDLKLVVGRSFWRDLCFCFCVGPRNFCQ